MNVCFAILFEVLVSNMFLDLIMQVRVYDMASMSCSYVLSGHTEIVLCLDTCVSSSGRALIVTGSKDKSVSFLSSCSQSSCGWLGCNSSPLV